MDENPAQFTSVLRVDKEGILLARLSCSGYSPGRRHGALQETRTNH